VKRALFIILAILPVIVWAPPGAASGPEKPKKDAASGIASGVDIVKLAMTELYAMTNPNAATDYFDPGYVDHSPLAGYPATANGLMQYVAEMRLAFPDLALKIDDAFQSGDLVVVRGSLSGVNQGIYLGRPPTMHLVIFNLIDIYRIRNNKIIERWGERDIYGLMSQIGAVPPPASAPVAGAAPVAPVPITPAVHSDNATTHQELPKASTTRTTAKKKAKAEGGEKAKSETTPPVKKEEKKASSGK